jgi:hypothetical protein
MVQEPDRINAWETIKDLALLLLVSTVISATLIAVSMACYALVIQ